jgi:hypothetical protein
VSFDYRYFSDEHGQIVKINLRTNDVSHSLVFLLSQEVFTTENYFSELFSTSIFLKVFIYQFLFRSRGEG